ncbi:cytochrome P450 [Mangrovimicrobium sediminis]|uniref:Cytochrome P450 n=1 Tax=Mangrovimicrobium sediminis TaxID=2562682 RepID=A0A4Z0M1L5_9GAMM|nr:cytochrome P450 [Haliea sp. SAOS-164]TGD73419.1 cytochrome P450 [Haliea sp. SAOS-164]
MQTPEQLDLAYMAMESREFSDNPFPHFDAARERHPWLARCAFGVVVHEFQAIQDLLIQDDKMCSDQEGVVAAMQAEGTPWGRFQVESILGRSGDSHKRIRDVVAPMFTPREANKNRQLMRDVVSMVLDEWAPKGEFDFEEFASYFPVSVMTAMIGAPLDAIPRLRQSMEDLGLSFSMDLAHMPALQAAVGTMDDFVRDLVARRRAGERPGDEPDLLDTLLAAVAAGQLADDEVYNLLIFLFVAGYDTSKNILTLAMYSLLEHPDIYQRCASDYEYCSKVIEETFRLNSPATIPRRLQEDIVYRDVLLEKDSMLFFTVGMSGRDPRAFERPDVFDPDREKKNYRHMAFGRGVHLCLGQYIARAQLQEGLHLIAQRLRNPVLAGEIGHRPFFGVWGLRGLPIRFEPAPDSALERSIA